MSEFEDKAVQLTQIRPNAEKMNDKSKDILRESQNNIKCTNSCIILVPGEDKRQRTEKLVAETMSGNFPYLGKETNRSTKSGK